MSLQIIYGVAGTGKSTNIYNEIKEKLEDTSKNQIKVITPEQFSFTAEKKLLDISKNGSVIKAEVITFNRMAYRIMQEIGGKTIKNISKSGKNMLIKDILLRDKNNYTFLGKTDENVELISRQITELKKHNISIDSLKETTKEMENEYLKLKLEDINKIYEEYISRIENMYLDENDGLSILAEKLEMSKEFKNCNIYIDEFAGFTTQEYEILRILLKISNKVTITICCDNLDFNTNPDIDIFYTNKQTAKRIIEIAENEKIKINEPMKLNKIYRFKNEELKHLAENIEIPFYQKYEEEVKNISLFLANNAYSEIEHIAAEITKLVIDENYRYEDIAIISKNLETYSSLCKVIFRKYNIPVFIDEKKDLSQNIIIQYILSLLDIFSKNWSYEAVVGYIKTGFTNLDEIEIASIENYALKYGIKGSNWYKKEWKFYNEQEEQKQVILHARQKLINPLIEFKESLKGLKTVEDITKRIYKYFLDNEIPQKLQQKIDKLEKIGEIELANQYSSSWKTVINVLDEICEVLGTKNISFDLYSKILKTGFESTKLGSIPGTADQVILGDTERSRTHKVKACFIIGLNDGIFPGKHKDEGFLDDKDRITLKDRGIELAKGTLEQLYDDHFNIYKAFTTAEEKVYLSYSSSDSEGKSLRPSILVNKVKKIFEKIEEESDILERKSEILLKDTTFDELLINLRKFIEGEEISPIWFNAYNYYEKYYREKLEISLKALDYINNPTNIDKEKIDKIYGNTLTTSVSRLEKFESCPFSYYLKYGLKIKEQEALKVEAIDTGNFMHETIDEFFGKLEERNIKIKDRVNENDEIVNGITDEQIEEITNEIVDEKLSLQKYEIFNIVPKYIVLAKRLRKILLRLMKYIVYSLKYSDFDILGHEVEFNKDKDFEPITYSLPNGKKVEIIGKIDRIDIAKMPDGKYIRIIDYKSSAKDIDLNEVLGGIQLQLLTYLDAVCKKDNMQPAGTLYFTLLEPLLKKDKDISVEELENSIKQSFKMNGLILSDLNIIKGMDKNLAPGSASNIINVKLKNDGELSANKNCINRKQFEYLQGYVETIIKKIANEIYEGNISIYPYNIGKTPCQYCEYKQICNFNKITKNNYRYIPKYSKEEAINKMKESNESN